jgi:hypothetical protein
MPNVADVALIASLTGLTLYKAQFVPSAYGVGFNLLLTFSDGRSLMVTPCAHLADCGVHITVSGLKRDLGGAAP